MPRDRSEGQHHSHHRRERGDNRRSYYESQRERSSYSEHSSRDDHSKRHSYHRHRSDSSKSHYDDSRHGHKDRLKTKESLRDSPERRHERRHGRASELQKPSWNYYGYTSDDLKDAETLHKDRDTTETSTGTQASVSFPGSSSKQTKEQYQDLTQVKHAEKKRAKEQLKSEMETSSTSGLFDWDSHRYELDKLFFDDDGVFKRGSSDYADFWSFFERYQSFQSKKLTRTGGQKAKQTEVDKHTKTGKLKLPRTYDKRHRINLDLTVPSKHTLKSYSHVAASGEERDELTSERVLEFKKVLLLYLDFNQKQQFNKVVKLRKDQSNLPIARYKETIVEAVRKNSVVIVAGDTGCGKSTQVPQYLMSAGFDSVAVTQPRRIACISLAKRVGYETLHEYGSQVGYQIRFETTKTQATKLLFLTEGLLLRQLQLDPVLSQYHVLILDEVHERHLHGDFLLGVLRCMMEQRDDLKLVLMSATININLFSNYFKDAPVIQVPGRLYPIQVEYVPINESEQSSKSERLDPRPYLRIMQRIDHKYPDTERGDLLVFLSGMSEITSVVEAARMYASQTKRWIVLPLHSSLSVAEQDKAFDIAPEGVRKCIVSTNIAETSVTIDGVRFIVDSGKVKEMNYNSQAKMQQLQEFWISRASSEQRKGRAGRTGPGVCFRLYAESDYDAFQAYSTPEIQRVPLDSLLLQMVALGLKNPREFPFIEAPPASSIENSIVFLKEQGALSEKETLTPVGRMLSQLPVDVVIGKMLIMGTIFKMIDPVLSIAAALSVQSPFTSRAHRDHDAMSARKSLESEHGDPFTLLNAYDEWIQMKASGGSSSRKWCKRRGLEEQRFYEMSKLKRQFKELLDTNNLLGVKDEKREFSSLERQSRNRERKRLKELKRKTQNATKRRKLLKLEREDVDVSDEDEESDDDASKLADIQFKLSHDVTEMEAKSNMNRSLLNREINLLKVILCSGLYPQLAIADDCNSYRKESDQVFHTKAKPFVVLHPTGIFANNPDLLEPPDGDTLPEETTGKRGVLSAKHQLLSYVSLLETNKPYLMNTMRVPALQTMLLYARSLDTNQHCTRLIVDEWLEFCFADSQAAEDILPVVLHLRATWMKVLEMRLKESQFTNNFGATNLKVIHLERLLARKLAEYLSSHVEYTMRKLSGTDLQHLYIGPSGGVINSSDDEFFSTFSKDSEPHPTKGGWKVTDFMTYGCLIEDASNLDSSYTSVLRKHWTCPTCERGLVVTLMERLQHEADCSAGIVEDSTKSVELGSPSSTQKQGMESLRRLYECSMCKETFSFTSSEIIKHKRAHLKEKSGKPD
ncbi:probable ATP-dependent RNA helicase DHX34 isoform X2 [Lytechinus pictus]|uniref:probable ATP-dependent RNA helicase DHX34 isoform X2 n=1 Tax=Lytechinus pictus TaxID=7653 RepID=UPI0030B9E613